MVDRINGAPQTGFWFSQDVRVVRVTATAGGDFINDVTNEVVNSELEQVLEVLATRGTIIAVNPTAAGIVDVMLDYANAFTVGNTEATTGSVEEAIAADVDAIGNLATIAIAVFNGFQGLALGA